MNASLSRVEDTHGSFYVDFRLNFAADIAHQSVTHAYIGG